MITEISDETPDLSFYTDKLEALTLRPRRFWAQFPIEFLRQALKRELKTQARLEK
jgi:hypothetical protein